MTWSRGLLVAPLLGLVAACGADGRGSPGPRDLEGFPVEPAAEVTLTSSGLDPQVVQVGRDEIVELRISRDEPAECLAVNGDVELRTGRQGPGSSVALRLTEPGTYVLTCEGDGEATARLVVAPAR